MSTARLGLWDSSALARKSYASIPEVLQVPNLVQIQLDSFEWFLREGLQELFEEISPISDFTGNRMELRFGAYEFKDAKYTIGECRERDLTYARPLFVTVELLNKETGEKIESPIFMGDFPMMTPNGTFVVNGAERVVVSQLVRSPGVYFTVDEDPTTGRHLAFAKLIPNRGAWLEFETSNKDLLSVKVDRRRKVPITTLLRSVGFGQDEQLYEMFAQVDTNPDHQYLRATMDKEAADAKTERGALMEFYRRLRPGDPPNEDNARSLVQSLFFNPRRYDLGRVGRYKLNKRLNLSVDLKTRVITRDDLVEIVRHLIQVNNGQGQPDDIDHLGNRRVRAVGELIQNQFRIGLLRIERVIRERMTIVDPAQASPTALVNIRPVVAAIKEFFGGSQLSQFMDQTNPLAELTHKRRLSALGPGGLSRDRAGFDVRDVHHSHYGRICPIETPEGPNIGLIGSLATYGRVNTYGFIETPYRRVLQELRTASDELLGRMVRSDIRDEAGDLIVARDEAISAKALERIKALPPRMIPVRPFVSDDVDYLSADQEEAFIVAQANSPLDAKNQFTTARVEARRGSRFLAEPPERVHFMDVSPKQIVSVATSLIPFLEHDDANRALMGSNMQRQAVPLIRPEVPLVGTGMEGRTAADSGQVIAAPVNGVITRVDARRMEMQGDDGSKHGWNLTKFMRSNNGTCINQRVIVRKGDRVQAGRPLADSSSTDGGLLALGQNILCAFMSWEGYNFEDAIIISEEMVREDKFTSIHIEKHEIEARDTKLGPEEITRDIPNVGEESLRDLDEYGIIRVGAEVGPGDILVGKITPKGETELTAEEKLLRAIFGEKAREVKDTSLRVPHGEHGKVIDVKVFSREENTELPAGVNQMVRVSIAQRRKLSEGDKMAGRHGNKGVIARILPVEDMPYLADGTPVQIILNPIGVPSRMNVGQVLETHLGYAAGKLGYRVETPVFDGATTAAIEDALGRSWLADRATAEIRRSSATELPERPADRARYTRQWLEQQGIDPEPVLNDRNIGAARRVAMQIWLGDNGVAAAGMADAEMEAQAAELTRTRLVTPPVYGKSTLYDGRTGVAFDQPVTVGTIYMLKLVHLVEDKIHARSTGPYSLITQQPLGGKAQFGGQRFGEMEVWALEAYGAAYILQELLTVKSDDVVGRVKTYESIVKGEDILEPGVPESFKVLVKELQSLALSIEVLNEDEERVVLLEDTSGDERPLGLEGIDITGWEKGEG